MTLKISGASDKLVAGKLISKHLEEELAIFSTGPAGEAMLGPILTGSDVYTVVIQAEKPTATFAKNINIHIRETKGDVAVELDDLKELVESTIFELTNAKNSALFSTLERELEDGSKQLREFGRDKAGCEAEASWNVFKILSERNAYVPSAWGNKQIEACTGRTDLREFKTFFIAAPHDSTANVGSDAALPSNEYYSFYGAYKLGGKAGKLQNQFVQIKDRASGKVVLLDKLRNKFRNSATINSMNMKAATYYWVAIDFIIANKASMILTWKGAGEIDYQFTDAMKVVAADTGGLMRADFDKAWTNKKADLLQ